MGIFIIRNKNESKQKRLPWQEAVFSVAEKFGRLSPQGGDLVQNHIERNLFCNMLRILHIERKTEEQFGNIVDNDGFVLYNRVIIYARCCKDGDLQTQIKTIESEKQIDRKSSERNLMQVSIIT